MKDMKKIKRLAKTLVGFTLFWVLITCFVQLLACPKMTQGEILRNIPNSIMTDFTICE